MTATLVSPNRAAITAGILLVSFLGSLEATVVSTAMPTIAEAIGDMEHYIWVFVGYMLPLTVTGPLWGKLSDLFGRRRVYLFAIGLFILGSMLSGCARSMHWLIAMRILQGVGGGGIVPLGQATLADIYTTEERARIQGVFTLVYGLASAAGPALGGYIAEYWCWRWVFYLNMPFGLAGAILLARTLKDAERRKGPISLDWPGAVLFCAAFTSLLLLLDDLGRTGGASPRLFVGLIVSLAALAGFLLWERRCPSPLIPLGLFRSRMLAASAAYLAIAGALLFGAISCLPLFYESAVGLTPAESGHAMTPLLITWTALSAVTASLALRIGFRLCALISALCFTLAYAGLSCFGPATPAAWISAAATLIGIGAGFCMVPLLIGVQNSTPKELMGTATSCVVFSRNFGAAIGISLMGMGIAAAGARDASSMLLERTDVRALVYTALHRSFFLALFVALAAWIPAWFVLPRTSPRSESA